MAKTKNKAASAQRGQIITLISIVVVLLIIAALILIKINKPSSATPATTLAPADVVAATTGVPASAFSQIGDDPTTPRPSPIKESTSLTNNGLPEVLYMGADYCPFCAAQRWALVSALSRFGTFSNLGATSSASNDVYPNTQTFTFHGATYSSKYISFVGVELQTNIPSNGSYTPLDNPTAQQDKLINTWDLPPYTPSKGGIPFVDFANKYVLGGAGYNPGILQGLSLQTIAGSLSNTSSAPAKAILGTANLITATICKIDNNQPSSVCNLSYIQQIEKSLK
ncbi:MAG: DUF929 domain-containing protein [Actinomycetota bacterium]|nr:MAG: DUF929 domain-containing protein [Actinomycetota bacterium]